MKAEAYAHLHAFSAAFEQAWDAAQKLQPHLDLTRGELNAPGPEPVVPHVPSNVALVGWEMSNSLTRFELASVTKSVVPTTATS